MMSIRNSHYPCERIHNAACRALESRSARARSRHRLQIQGQGDRRPRPGARYVLEGSVKRSGDDVRVNANLADAQTGITIWSQQIDRKMTDIDFLVQDKIVGRIVAKIAGGYGVIEATEVRSARRKSPEQLAAYDLFQRAHA